MLKIVVIVACIFVIGETAEHHHAWDYKEFGRDWPGYCKTGHRQSPIHLSLRDAVYDENLSRLKFNYADNVQGNYANNGHSVSFAASHGSQKSTLSGGGLPGEYIFHSFHYHWGSNHKHCDGSEHIIDNDCTPFELHMVHYNSKYGSLGEAKTKSDGIAVVGILFNPAKGQVMSKLGQYLSQNAGSLLAVLKEPNTKISDKRINMNRYIEDFVEGDGEFFRYLGSLTTPTCDETVTWTVMTKRLDVDPELLAKFRAVLLTNAHGEHKPSPNYRALQPLNGRTVYTNHQMAQGAVGQSLAGKMLSLLFTIFAF